MKYSLLAALLCLLFVPETHAQAFADSFFVEVWKSPAGEKAAFERTEFSVNRLDATGDGISELITVEDNQNGLPILMRVRDLAASTEVMTIDLRLVRERLLEDGFSSDQLRELSFLSFYKWSKDELGWVVFEANDEPVFVRYDAESPTVFGMPGTSIASIYDYDADGFEEIMVATQAGSTLLASINASSD